MTTKPNILLVARGMGRRSHWRHVIPSLHAKGYRVRAVQNPLTSLADEGETLGRLLPQWDPTPGTAIVRSLDSRPAPSCEASL